MSIFERIFYKASQIAKQKVLYFFGVYLYIFPLQAEFIVKANKMQNSKEFILNPLFNLPEFQLSLSMPNLSKKIEISEIIERPSVIKSKKKYELTLLDSLEKKIFSLNERVYLTQVSNSLKFSSQPTNFGFEMQEQVDNKIRCQLFLQIDSSHPEICIEKEDLLTEIPLFSIPKIKISDLKQEDPFFQLAEAKWCERDQLFELFGDVNYQKLAFKQRLLFTNYEIYFDQDDWMIWKDGKWQIETLENANEAPLAHILSKTLEGIEIEGWDIKGEKKYSFFIKQLPPSPIISPSQKVFQSLRLKTKYQVTAQIGKKSFFLRTGDALVMKGAEEFFVLKNFKVNESFFEKIKGLPLIVFEKIERQSQKRLFVGYLFDSYHLQPSLLRIPIEFSGSIKEEKQKKVRAIFRNLEKTQK